VVLHKCNSTIKFEDNMTILVTFFAWVSRGLVTFTLTSMTS